MYVFFIHAFNLYLNSRPFHKFCNSSDTLSKNVLKTSDYSLMLKCDYFHLMAFAFSITACFLWKNFLSSPILCFRIVFHHRN